MNSIKLHEVMKRTNAIKILTMTQEAFGSLEICLLVLQLQKKSMKSRRQADAKYCHQNDIVGVCQKSDFKNI